MVESAKMKVKDSQIFVCFGLMRTVLLSLYGKMASCFDLCRKTQKKCVALRS